MTKEDILGMTKEQLLEETCLGKDPRNLDCVSCLGCVDCCRCLNCSNCEVCRDCSGCYTCIYCTYCIESERCHDCHYCYKCFGLKYKKHCAFNVQLTEVEYKALMEKLK